MTYIIKKTSQFKKSYKLAVKRGLDVTLLEDVINKLKEDIPLEEKFHDHQLSGNMKLFRECHINPDWLLVYLKQESILTLTLVDTGTHSDLFGK
ncbi:MAG: type II toxin-antitoxin system YafQ family toxin [Spirochaetaceae bacterium]|nr:type II toxin-antitoxin system YafQ family toxin [Spirochaetaceae bacterium]